MAGGTAGAAGGAAGAAGGAAGAAGGAAGAAGGAAGTGGPPMCMAGESCTAGSNCQTECAPSGMATYCTCTTLPGTSTMEYACVRISCSRDAGTDAGPTLGVCPNDVRGGNVACDDNTDTICLTPCESAMRTACVCTSRGAGGARWICASQPMSCQ
jgi:hypothetical protein